MSKDAHWCKWCDTTFKVDIPHSYSGDAFLCCPSCKHKHSRQIELGTAVSCDAPILRPRVFEGQFA